MDDLRPIERGQLSPLVKEQVVAAHSRVCFYCSEQGGIVDHIDPLALGGSHELENLICSCRLCNVAKGAKLLDEPRRSAALEAASEAAHRIRRENPVYAGPVGAGDQIRPCRGFSARPSEVLAIEDWAFAHGMNYSAAVRCMIRFALANGVKPDNEADLRRVTRQTKRKLASVGT